MLPRITVGSIWSFRRVVGYLKSRSYPSEIKLEYKSTNSILLNGRMIPTPALE